MKLSTRLLLVKCIAGYVGERKLLQLLRCATSVAAQLTSAQMYHVYSEKVNATQKKKKKKEQC